MATNFTETDLERIDRAIAQGVRTVHFADGRQIEYSTFEEMVSRRNFIAKELGKTSGRQRILAKFTKGVE